MYNNNGGGEGLDAATFTTTERTDGSTQVKAGSWPLYYFAADAAPGDVNGQGQGDVWYVVSPTAERARRLPGPQKVTRTRSARRSG